VNSKEISDIKRHVVFIGLVWPEPRSSAAGKRMNELLRLFADNRFLITFCSAAQKNEYSELPYEVEIHQADIKLNDASFDDWITSQNPDIVVFDRFVTEEQFGWRVAKFAPNALRILDTEDLHFLREARRISISSHREENDNNLLNPITMRELASIYRCDLSIVISEVERNLLIEYFQIPSNLLYTLGFLRKPLSFEYDKGRPYHQRHGFIFIGNFMHAPNKDAVYWLKEKIWPLIRQKLSTAELKIYGAYMKNNDLALHRSDEGFTMMGRAEDAVEVLSQARVLLAPVRFGAGLKGKCVDAMQAGTPSITTQVGAEGFINVEADWCGFIANEPEAIAYFATQLHENETLWIEKQRRGFELFNKTCASTEPAVNFMAHVMHLIDTLKNHRKQNIIGAMFQHHRMQSTYYMAKWIEEKNASNAPR
jgi:glycosyltransferase involved in cell wall biosynthesis